MPNCPVPTGEWTTPRSPASSTTPGCRCRARDRAVCRAGSVPRCRAASPAWLRWRADQLHRFYGRAQETLATARPAALGFGRRRMAFRRGDRSRIAAPLPRASNLVESLLNTGIYLRQYQADPRLVLLRPEQIVPPSGSMPRRSIWKSANCPTPTRRSPACRSRAVCSSIRRRKCASPRSTSRALSSQPTPGW